MLAHPATLLTLAALSLVTAAADAGGGLVGSLTGLILAVGSLVGALVGAFGAYLAWRQLPKRRR